MSTRADTASMDREEVVRHAKKIVASATIPAGCRVVVALTDENGGWVGVASNTSNHDVETILVSALEGAERIDHPPHKFGPTPAQIPEGLPLELDVLKARVVETALAGQAAFDAWRTHMMACRILNRCEECWQLEAVSRAKTLTATIATHALATAIERSTK